jgi:hypothetical protein
MHVVLAIAAATAEARISGAWHKRLYNFSATRYPSILNPIFKTAINPIPNPKLVRTIFFPCFNISPRTACAAR